MRFRAHNSLDGHCIKTKRIAWTKPPQLDVRNANLNMLVNNRKGWRGIEPR
jgi:hypothetical protein